MKMTDPRKQVSNATSKEKLKCQIKIGVARIGRGESCSFWRNIGMKFALFSPSSWMAYFVLIRSNMAVNIAALLSARNNCPK